MSLQLHNLLVPVVEGVVDSAAVVEAEDEPVVEVEAEADSAGLVLLCSAYYFPQIQALAEGYSCRTLRTVSTPRSPYLFHSSLP
jgi:hypothetical protein